MSRQEHVDPRSGLSNRAARTLGRAVFPTQAEAEPVNRQRVPWGMRRLLGLLLCLVGHHRLGYRRRRRVFENWNLCVYCGRLAWTARRPWNTGKGPR